MSISRTYNLNKYTTVEKGKVDKINFYLQAAMLEKDTYKKNNSLHVTFELKKEKEDKLYDMHIFLIKNKDILYRSYSLYLKEIDEYYYAILKNKSDIKHAEVLPKNTINFNELDFNTFKKLLSSEEEFTNMIPELTNALKEYQEEINDKKEVALTIDIPTPTNYYHNVVGNTIISIEEIIANEEEQDITDKILNQAKKKFEVVLSNDYDRKLALLNLQAYNLYQSRSVNLKPQDILKDSELKTDTNKEELTTKELFNTLDDFIKDEELSEDNIISERIHYILSEKPRLKEMTNYLRIILSSNNYINDKRRVRAISEFDLKELLIKSLVDETYLPLPRNEVLIYHLNEDIIDFLCIISLDLIEKLFNTYKLNYVDENEKACVMYNDIQKLLNNKNISRESHLTILIELITIMYLYYYRNINSKTLLFNKGEYIINLDYYKGDYDIKIVNKNNKKVFGKLIKITDEMTSNIKESLDKGEKYFTECINSIIYNNFNKAIVNQSLNIEIKSLTHKGIKYILRRAVKENIFECNFPIDVMLMLLISPNKPRATSPKEEIEIVDNNYKYNIPINDYEYIVRKADTISKIMENSPINNKTYKDIVKYYDKFKAAKEEKKTEILLKLAELFKIEITDIKSDDNE